MILQVTAEFVVFATVAVNCCVVPVTTLAVDGETDTEIGRMIVTEAVPDLVGSAADVALTTT